MGRYYSGDIEGKFLFGVQYSNAADRFGVQGHEPNYITYYYKKKDIDTVRAELDYIIAAVGEENILLLNAFFSTNTCYNDKIMAEYNPELPAIWKKHASDYADYLLGTKIYNYLLEHICCEFVAEI